MYNTLCKIQLLSSPEHDFRFYINPLELQIGGFLLGFSQLTPKLLGSSSPQGSCHDQTPSKQRTVEFDRPLLLLPPTSVGCYRGGPALPALSVLCMLWWGLTLPVSTRLLTLVPQIRTHYQRPPRSATCCVGSAHHLRLPLEELFLIPWYLLPMDQRISFLNTNLSSRGSSLGASCPEGSGLVPALPSGQLCKPGHPKEATKGPSALLEQGVCIHLQFA